MGKNRTAIRKKRIRARVRSKIHGSSERPRLCVFRSNKHIYAQLIDDDAGHTIAAASSAEKDVDASKSPMELSKEIGKLVGERGKSAGHETVIFDRNIYRYHGRVKALAEGAREAGLKF